MTDLAAVLWDMDGTLVDTEPYWIETEIELVDQFGGTWSLEDAQSIIGSDLIDAGTALRDRGGVDLEPRAIVERLLDGVVDKLERRGVPWRPGAASLLAECAAAGVPCALVTMSWRRFADAVMTTVPEGSFVLSMTGDEVSRGKPHPEPYRKASHALGVDPTECVAIEDSRTGVASALGAGCATLGVPHVVSLAAAPGLTIVESLEGVDLSFLRSLVAAN